MFYDMQLEVIIAIKYCYLPLIELQMFKIETLRIKHLFTVLMSYKTRESETFESVQLTTHD